MKKIAAAAIIIGVGISLVGCDNSAIYRNTASGKITIEEAKEIALKHANLTSDQVTFGRSEIDFDDGIEKYDIEFYHGNKEYDYEINASNGEIIKYDYDAEYNNVQQGTINDSTANNNIANNTANISEEQAKEIALKHANLTSDQVKFVRVERDFDDGIQKYDIEFYYGNKEYDYEINASNGQIIKYDYDIEYNNVQQGTINDSTANNNIANNTANNNATNNNTANISVEQAKEIALKHANLTSDQVNFVKVQRDFDDGIQKYDIEFYYGNKEYDYEINAFNGEIIKYDYDVEYNNVQQGTINDGTANNNTANISVEQAKEIALKHANLTGTQVNFVKVERDFDDGIQKYDVEFYHNNIEYSYEIDASTGSILSYERE